MGGVKWVSNPCVRKNDDVVYLSDAECSYPPKEGPLLPVEGWLHTPNEVIRIDSQGMRACSSKMGGCWISPLRFTGLLPKIASEYLPLKLQTANDSIVDNKRL